jgi:dolichyl-diphosphooligosaccharide--protein glycosyltransferase
VILGSIIELQYNWSKAVFTIFTIGDLFLVLHARFDELSWYPLGRVVGGTVYPGIMYFSFKKITHFRATAGLIYWVLNKLHFTIHIREVCVFLAPLFSMFTAFATYLLTAEMKDSSAGLLAALFIGIVPGYISRSVAGSYDNEAIAIFLLVFTFYLWIKAVKTGSAFYGTLTALFYFYMVASWGGYVFITNMIPLHVFVLILMGRYDGKLYVSYSTFYIIGTLSSMQIPFVGFLPLRTSEHMAALGIFGLLQIVAFFEVLRSHLSKNEFNLVFNVGIAAIFALGLSTLVFLVSAGYIAPFTGRYYSLWDTGYAKIHIPIISSVSEHQPTAWPSFFFDLGILMPLLPAGVYYCFLKLRNEHMFVIIYATLASYFAGVMVRLMLTLTPIVCVASSLAISAVLEVFLKNYPALKAQKSEGESNDDLSSPETASPTKSSGKKKNIPSALKRKSSVGSVDAPSGPVAATSKKETVYKMFGISSPDLRLTVIFPIGILLCQWVAHCTWVTANAYSSPSVVLASQNRDGSQHIIDDFREAYYWLRQNTDEKAKVMSWWDYGYQITGFSNRTVLVDNNTWNNTHIATVGKAMSCSEEVSYEVMKKLDVDYVLVIFGALIGISKLLICVGYSGDDINKFLWMIRIGQGVYPKDISERKFFTDRGEYKVGAGATETMKNSLMYKLSYYRFSEYSGPHQMTRDHVRGEDIPNTPIKLSVVDEGTSHHYFFKKIAFSSENSIVRIYKVKRPDNIGRPLLTASK